MPNWFPVEPVQEFILWLMPGLALALLAGWTAGAIGLIGFVKRSR